MIFKLKMIISFFLNGHETVYCEECICIPFLKCSEMEVCCGFRRYLKQFCRGMMNEVHFQEESALLVALRDAI